MEKIEYTKITGPFERFTEPGPNRNKLIPGRWSCREFDVLQNAQWMFTEKVDGTNVRVFWDGHKPTFGGRTAEAQMPTKLLAILQEMFQEELLEQTFGGTQAILFGEGYGAGIQKGGVYRPDPSFVMFDVAVPRVTGGYWWLERASVADIGFKMGVDVIPLVYTGTLNEGIDIVRQGFRSTWNGNHVAEGLVGIPTLGLLNRAGQRIIVKLKTKDLLGIDYLVTHPKPEGV